MPVRSVKHDGEGLAGSFWSDKLQRSVEYESELERAFFARVERWPAVVRFTEQPVWIPLGSPDSIYCPDCLLTLEDGAQVIVEVKPMWLIPLHANWERWRALRRFAAERGVGVLITDGRRTAQAIRNHQPMEGFEREVLGVLRQRDIHWREYFDIKRRWSPSGLDFASLVLRNRLEWHLSPFRLTNHG